MILYVVKCLDEYPVRSQIWRTKTKRQILLNYIFSHQEISSSTVSDWIETTLKLSDVSKLGQFRGHSTRSASTSKAYLVDLLVNDILCRGSWSNEPSI